MLLNTQYQAVTKPLWTFLPNTFLWCLTIALLSLVLQSIALAATTDDEKAQTIVHMLDYLGVDYAQTVQNGQVVNTEEYGEQREFATQVITLPNELSAAPEKVMLVHQARELLARIEAKAPGGEISALADQLHIGVIRAWRLSVAPRQPPDLRPAGELFARHCTACHGTQGRGDGPLAKGMEPEPRNFHDDTRMRQRSLYGLYNTISLGVPGTQMRGFRELSEGDRWALAFYTAGLRTDLSSVANGETSWQQGDGKATFHNLRALVTTAPAQLGPAGSTLDHIQAFLTQQPQALQIGSHEPLAFSLAMIEDAAQAYANGNREEARRLAIAAYLEGFELIESALSRVDASLRTETEREMMGLRTAIIEGRPTEVVTDQTTRIKILLGRADAALSEGKLSPSTAFVSSLLILLR